MKIAISGKGGSGKTTIAAALSYIYSEKKEVLAIDCDPDSDLALALGISKEKREAIKPLSSMKDLIEERIGKDGFFRLNPDLGDIIDKVALKMGNIRLIVMGGVKKEGCFCAENRFLRETLGRAILENSIVIMDMEPGIEHLSRKTAADCNVLLIVIEPGIRSIKSGKIIEELALSLGIPNIMIVANKIKNKGELEMIMQNFSLPIFKVSYHENLIFQDGIDGCISMDVIDEVKKICETLSLK